MTEFIRRIGPLHVWRCTEAVDARSAYAFRTIGNAEGRCIEIASPQNSMLFDRRLARQLAEAILEICGPAEELPSDLAQTDTVQVVYDAAGAVVGFTPFVPPTPVTKALRDSEFVSEVRSNLALSWEDDQNTRI